MRVLAYARSRNVTKLVVGKPNRRRWRELLHGSTMDQLVRRSGDIDVYVIRGRGEETEAEPLRAKRATNWRGYAWALLVVALATAAELAAVSPARTGQHQRPHALSAGRTVGRYPAGARGGHSCFRSGRAGLRSLLRPTFSGPGRGPTRSTR